MKLGLALTTIYIIAIVILIPILSPDALGKVASMGLNEWGDFLAGVFGPVAFLWLILGYKQQGNELKQNTKALEYQVEELKKSVEQQKVLTKTTQEQLELEKEKLKINNKKFIAEAKPYLDLTIDSEVMDPFRPLFVHHKINHEEPKITAIKIENFGAEARKIVIDSNGGVALINNDLIHECLIRGASKKYPFLQHKKIEDYFEVKLSVAYQDIYETDYLDIFSLHFSPNNACAITKQETLTLSSS